MAAQVTAHINPEDIRLDNTLIADYTIMDLPVSVFQAYRSCLIRAFEQRRIVLHAVHSISDHGHEYARLFLCHRSGGQITSAEAPTHSPAGAQAHCCSLLPGWRALLTRT